MPRTSPGRPAGPDAAADAHRELDQLGDDHAVDQLGDDRRGERASGPPWPVLRASCPRQTLRRDAKGRKEGRDLAFDEVICVLKKAPLR